MQAAVLVLLLGVSLSGVHGSDEQFTPDVLSMVRELQTKVQTLENLNRALQTSVAQLQASPRVAFFANFGTNMVSLVPSDAASPIKYNNVVTNVGNGYNSATGIFTAPLRGLYVFHVSMYASVLQPPFGPLLKKNTETLANPLITYTAGKQDAATRVAVVTLERGDTVFMEQYPKTFFAESFGQINSFSGFLLSPM